MEASKAGGPATGSCLCGAVRFAASGPLRDVSFCHCRMCRRSLTNFGAYAACAPDVLAIEGRKLRWFRSSPIAERGFCAACGSQLFWRPSDGGHVSISAGSFDDPSRLVPGRHIFVAEAWPPLELDAARGIVHACSGADAAPDPSDEGENSMAIQRRTLLRGSAAAAAAALAGGPALAQGAASTPAPDAKAPEAKAAEAKAAAAPPPGAAPKGPPAEPITHILARYAATAPVDQIPPNVRHEAARTLLNWVGVAVGGSREGAPSRAVKALLPFSGPAQANLFGRTERMDALHAALVNGISSHVLDFDDTHLKTIIHPAGPVASALTAWAQHRPVSGADFMNAMVLGCEIELRMGNSVYPEHYAKGWHITGTTGVFGAAAATGRLLGLDERHMAYAIGLAASQPVGLKVQFGSDTKSFHPGRAAQNGMVSALLAEQGFTASEVAIEGFDGWGQAMSTRHDWSEVTEGLGTRYEIALNTYKPFAAGIVSHPAIDAAIQLRDADGIRPEDIRSVDLKVHPLVLNLMGKTDPRAGLEGKFSIYHAVAVALVTGRGGEKAFTDAAVADPRVVAVRKAVTAEVDPAIKADQVDMTVTLKDGRVLHKFIEHAVGSQANPMTDAQLEAKFTDLCDGVLPQGQVKRLIALCWGVWDLPDVGEIGRAGAAVA